MDVDQVTWPLTIQVFYQAAAQVSVPGVGPPEIRSILQQPAAQVLDTLSTQANSITRSVMLDQNLVVATQGSPRLLIVPS